MSSIDLFFFFCDLLSREQCASNSASPIELDQLCLCNPKLNSAAMRALLRCEHEVGVAGV
jgi:hypothetical protein